jgi:hypothetical protein
MIRIFRHGDSLGRAAGGIAALAIAAPLSAVTAAVIASASGPVTTHAISAAEQRAARTFWTPQRIAQAEEPAPPRFFIFGMGQSSSNLTIAPSLPVGSGEPGKVGGGRPVNRIPSVVAGRPGAHTYPYPYASRKVLANESAQWPYYMNGKIVFLFTTTGQHPRHVMGSCSGTSVASYHGTHLEDEVWTAGHCVANVDGRSPGVWATHIEFIPAYSGSSGDPEPFGSFIATRISVATSWLNNGDKSEDEAAFEVSKNAGGQTLGQAVGWAGFAWNYSAQQTFTTFGYPVKGPYNGRQMVQDIAHTAIRFSVAAGAGQPAIGIGSPMTDGSSGGGWIIDRTRTSVGYIDGHNDFKMPGQPLAMYSPYQDSLSNQVRCFGATSC